MLNKKEQELLDTLDELFENVPPIDQTQIVYRGISTYFPLESIKSFISTSLSFDVATSFSGKYCCLLYITLSPGSKILPLKELSYLPSEEEMASS